MEITIQEEKLINSAAEQAFLGAILLDNSTLDSCRLKPEHFGVEIHHNLFFVMRKLESEGKPINPVSILEVVKKEKIEKVGGVSYVGQLIDRAAIPSSITYYQEVIEDYFQRRRVAEVATELLYRLESQSGAESLQDAITEFTNMEDVGGNEDDGHIREALIKAYESFEVDQGDITGIPSGYPDLDALLSGFQAGDYIVIGARPSVGKTALALNIANNAAAAGDVVAIFSLEMNKELLIKRFISSGGNIDGMKMRNPRRTFLSQDWENTTMVIGDLSDKPIHLFDDSSVTIGEIRRKCRKLRQKYKGRRILIIIDYLQLIQGDAKHKGNRQAEISEISRMLKVIARDFDISVAALSQLSRGVEQRQDKRPMLSDLRESGQIEQDADVIAFLYRDDYYNSESEKKNIIEIIIAKQRNGPLGSVELVFLKKYNKFVSQDRSHQQIEGEPAELPTQLPAKKIPDMYRQR